jgi:hypothetical protein
VITIQTPARGALVFPDPAPIVRWFVSPGTGAYDAWARTTPPNRITSQDISALNRFARARTPERHWEAVISDRKWAWLKALDPEWDAATTTEDAWAKQDIHGRLVTAFGVLCGPHRGISVASKLLYFKRPRLIPLLDALVLEQLGVPVPGGNDNEERAAVAADLTTHLAAQARANRAALAALQVELGGAAADLSAIRLIDILLWSSHPAAGLRLPVERSVRLL